MSNLGVQQPCADWRTFLQLLPRTPSKIECSRNCKIEVSSERAVGTLLLTCCLVAELVRRLDAPRDRDHLVEKTHVTERETTAAPAVAVTAAPASVVPPVSTLPAIPTSFA